MATAELPRRVDFPREGYTLFVKPRPGSSHGAYHPANAKDLPGKQCAAVSTIAKAYPDRPDGLMKWTETMTLEGVARLRAADKFIPTDPYALRGVLEQNGLRYEQRRGAAADRGTKIHQLMFEALGRGDDVPDLDVLDPDEQGYGQAVFRWWEDRKPKPILVEREVLSLEHRYAGRLDLYGTIDAPPTDRFSGTGVVDAKTGKGVYRSDHVQQRLYELALKECGLGTCDWLMLLQLFPDGDYLEHYCVATEDDALLAIQAYEAAKRLDRNMKAA
jgi:hypothetical protein